jgi:hypothetical protein
MMLLERVLGGWPNLNSLENCVEGIERRIIL